MSAAAGGGGGGDATDAYAVATPKVLWINEDYVFQMEYESRKSMLGKTRNYCVEDSYQLYLHGNNIEINSLIAFRLAPQSNDLASNDCATLGSFFLCYWSTEAVLGNTPPVSRQPKTQIRNVQILSYTQTTLHINGSTRKQPPVNQSINQSKSISQPANQSINQSINQLVVI